MTRKLTCMAVAGLLVSSAAWAQEPRVEVGATVGWTWSEGVTGSAVTVPGVGAFDSIGPKDAASWGLRFGVMATPNIEVGGLFNQQKSTLQLSGTTTADLGDQSVNNYHGYVAYNFGDSDASVRPYFLGGLGATQYGSISAATGIRFSKRQISIACTMKPCVSTIFR